MTGTAEPDAGTPPWVTEVTQFWFAELGESLWFARNTDLDELIRTRFLALHEQLAASAGGSMTRPRPLLATVIVLDQFSRNLFRGNAQAFAADPVARRLARTALENDYDKNMNTEERYFLYLPFEHSEDRDDQARAVALISQLGREDWTRSAIAHRAIIDRFGRFPHRNIALGRASTAEEIAALKEPMGAF